MTRQEAAQKAAPYAPAFFLLLAVAAGGLRSPGGWAVFGAALLAWTLLRPVRLCAGGQAAALLFFCWTVAAALFSPDLSVSAPAAARQALLGFFFFSALSDREGEAGWLAGICLLAAAAAALMLFQRASTPWPLGFIGRNPGYSAAFCAAALPAALLAFLSGPGKKEKLLYAAFALLLAAGLIASRSRGAAFAAFAATAVGLGVTRRWRWLAGLLLGALAVAVLLPASTWENLLKFYDPRAYARPSLWGAALEAAAASPLLGWGPGRFSEAFELFKFSYFDGVSNFGHTTLHAHSELLNLAAEAGFPAALFFLAAAAGALLSGGVKKLPLKLCALTLLIQGLGDISFYCGAVALAFWGSLGFAAAGDAPAGEPWRSRPALAALCLAVLLAGTSPAVLSGLGRGYPAGGDASGNFVRELALSRSAALDNPRNPFPDAREGAVLSQAGDPAGAEAAYRRVLALEPGFAGVRLELARLLAARGERSGACAALAIPEGVLPPGNVPDGYQRALMEYDREAAAELRKKVCGKKKTGSGTATRPRTRSKATK